MRKLLKNDLWNSNQNQLYRCLKCTGFKMVKNSIKNEQLTQQLALESALKIQVLTKAKEADVLENQSLQATI
jgi:hypothetical protein